MSPNIYLVYEPPSAEAPYLAVMISPGGRVSCAPFATTAQAEAHNRFVAHQLEKPLNNRQLPQP
jgi:hypothetical protein